MPVRSTDIRQRLVMRMDPAVFRRAWARFRRWMVRPRPGLSGRPRRSGAATVLDERALYPRLSGTPLDTERAEICAELAELEQRALRQLAEAQENLDKVRAMQKRAGCPRTPVH